MGRVRVVMATSTISMLQALPPAKRRGARSACDERPLPDDRPRGHGAWWPRRARASPRRSGPGARVSDLAALLRVSVSGEIAHAVDALVLIGGFSPRQR